MRRAKYAFVTLMPLIWLVTVTFTASWHKVFDADPRIGFLAHARTLAGHISPANNRLMFNDRLDAVVTAILVLLVTLVLLESVRIWFQVLAGRKPARVIESAFVRSSFGEASADSL